MITDAIVLSSLVLAALYVACWLWRGDFRRQIEQPKYRFQQQLNSFDGRLQRPPANEDKGHEQ